MRQARQPARTHQFYAWHSPLKTVSKCLDCNGRLDTPQCAALLRYAAIWTGTAASVGRQGLMRSRAQPVVAPPKCKPQRNAPRLDNRATGSGPGAGPDHEAVEAEGTMD